MHLAARFCAKEAVAKALGLTGWSFRDVEVVATGAAPEVRLSGRGGRARGGARRRAGDLAHAHRTSVAGAVAIAAVSAAPGLARPALRGRRDARGRRLGDRGAGRASVDLMERAGARASRGSTAAVARRGPDPDRGRQGQQRRRRPGGRAAAARGRPRGDVLASRPRRATRDAREPRALRATPSRSAGGSRAGASWTRCSAPASRARRASRWRRRSRRSTAQDAPVVACDVPSGVNASTGEVEGGGRAGAVPPPPSTARRSAFT